AAVDPRRALALAAAAARAAPARRHARAPRAHAHRRPDAQPRARAHRDAATRLLRPALDRPPPELMDVRIASLILRFARPLETAYGELLERELVLLRLRGGDGVVGWGEAAPLEPYDGVALDTVRAALAAYEPILRDGDDLPGG